MIVGRLWLSNSFIHTQRTV